jgi:DNA-binding MarR family transcriptional regulator
LVRIRPYHNPDRRRLRTSLRAPRLDNVCYNEYIEVMASRLAEEIHQAKPFASAEEEAYLSLLRTADALAAALDRLLARAGLTATQYNVLRILRGAGASGLTCGETAERMLTHDPDITRLLDRLERRGLVRRSRERRDRRVVSTRITAAGLDLLRKLDAPIEEFHRRQLGRLGKSRLRALTGLLAAARQAASADSLAASG